MQNGRRNSTTKPGPEDRCRPVHYWPLQRLKVNEMKSKFIVVNEEEAASFVDDHHPFYRTLFLRAKLIYAPNIIIMQYHRKRRPVINDSLSR